MTFLSRIFGLSGLIGRKRAGGDGGPLYAAIVSAGREPSWYRDGAVPDTLDGRFDMIAALLSLVLIRLEAFGDSGRRRAVRLTESFVDDMDGTLRQIGIGDFVVGKHVGRMMGALGGRLTAFRAGLADQAQFAGAVRRNIFRDSPPSPEALSFVAEGLRRFATNLDGQDEQSLMRGELEPR